MRSTKNITKRVTDITSGMGKGGSYSEPRTQFGRGEAGSSKGSSSDTGKSRLHFWSPGETGRG